MPRSIAGGALQGLESILAEQFMKAQEAQRIAEMARSAGQRDRQLDLNERQVRLAEMPEPEKPVVVAGRLVMPSTGKVVFEAPKEAPSPMVVAAGSRVWNPAKGTVDLDAVDEPDKPMVLSPGQRAFNPDGAELFGVPDRPRAGGQGGGASPSGGGAGDLAAMAVRQPATLQGLTPTDRGAVMAQIAANPELRAQFENTRMEPIRQRATSILAAIGKLVTPDSEPAPDGTVVRGQLTPGGRAVFGEFTPPSLRGLMPSLNPAASTDAAAALQQVIGQQVVGLISEMKAQSQTGATGFGAMSVRELDVLESAATQLTRRLSEPAALQELLNMRDKLKKVVQDAGPAPNPAPNGGGVSLDSAQAGMGGGGANVTTLRNRFGY